MTLIFQFNRTVNIKISSQQTRPDREVTSDVKAFFSSCEAPFDERGGALPALLPFDIDIYYYLDRAMHSMQDYSAHGNIGLDNRVAASHAGNFDVDKTNFNWRDNNDRGRSGVSGCVVEAKTGDKWNRYDEALEQTAMCLATWMLGMIYR